MEAVITVVGKDAVGILAKVHRLRRSQCERRGSHPAHSAGHLCHDYAG